MDFQTFLNPLVIMNKILGLFLIDSNQDRKQVLWIFPIFLFFCYTFYENRITRSFMINGRFDLMIFAQDYGSAYSGLIAMIVIYVHNFAMRKKIKRLVENLGDFETKYFLLGVKKGDMKRKIAGFFTLLTLNLAIDFMCYSSEEYEFDILIYLGYALPMYVHYCCNFFQTELLIFTRNNFKEINASLRKLSDFDGKQVISMSEAHLRLLQISKDENSFFSIPIVAQLVHTFCIYIVMYGALSDSIIEELTVTLEIKKRMSYLKWSFVVSGSLWYILRTWVLVMEEVSQRT